MQKVKFTNQCEDCYKVKYCIDRSRGVACTGYRKDKDGNGGKSDGQRRPLEMVGRERVSSIGQ